MRTARMTMIIALSVAAVALPTAAGACDAADDTVEVTVTWLMPVPQGGWTGLPDASSATWPQTLATGTECGNSWFQVDDYLGQQSEIDAILEDEQLAQGEDSSVVVPGSWSFVEQQPCPTPTPTPTLEPDLDLDHDVQVPSGGGTVATPPAIIAAGAAVPAAASPRFAG